MLSTSDCQHFSLKRVRALADMLKSPRSRRALTRACLQNHDAGTLVA
jgi:hypothetical protein